MTTASRRVACPRCVPHSHDRAWLTCWEHRGIACVMHPPGTACPLCSARSEVAALYDDLAQETER